MIGTRRDAWSLESTSVPGINGVVVLNSDGTNIGSAPGGILAKTFSTNGTDAGAVYGKADADGILNVKLVATGGTNINISAGDLDVDLDFATDGCAVGNSTGEWVAGAGAVNAQTQRVVTSSATRTAAKTTVVAGGTVAAGAQSVTFVTDTAFTGTITGDTTPSNAVITFSVNGNDTLGAIAYTVTAGSMQILTVI